MNHRNAILVLKIVMVCLFLITTTLITSSCGGSEEKTATLSPSALTMSLSSTAFKGGESIPEKYTCSGQNVSPPLDWSSPPSGTQSLVIIAVDLDAKEFTHWALFNLPADCSELQEAISPQGQIPAGSIEGKNSFGKTGYRGPCPPSGRSHRYQFNLYAIDQSLDLKSGASKDQIFKAMQGHILAGGQLTGIFQR